MMLFLQFLLFFLPAISVFCHYGSTQIVCPPVVSFFQPQRTPTASCLHFLFKKNIHIPSKLPPLSLLTLLLLAGDINPNPGPPDCINFSLPMLDPSQTNTHPYKSLSWTIIQMCLPCQKPGFAQMLHRHISAISPHRVIPFSPTKGVTTGWRSSFPGEK